MVRNPYAGMDDLSRRVLARASNLADETRWRQITALHVLCGAIDELPQLAEMLDRPCLLRVIGQDDRPRAERIPLAPELEAALPGAGLAHILTMLYPSLRAAIGQCGNMNATQFEAIVTQAVASWQPPEPISASKPQVRFERA
jgi:hypothetical protein